MAQPPDLPHSPTDRARQTVLQEWKHLCFALEQAQGDHLVATCRDKYQYAKTYLVYGRELDHLCVEVRQSAKQGNYQFFVDRGISARHLTPILADEMLRAWRTAIASKRARVAEMFQRRFGEDIDEFIGTPHNASRLVMAVAFDRRDAVLALADWTQDKLVAAELVQLRADLDILKQEVDRLACVFRAWCDRP